MIVADRRGQRCSIAVDVGSVDPRSRLKLPGLLTVDVFLLAVCLFLLTGAASKKKPEVDFQTGRTVSKTDQAN